MHHIFQQKIQAISKQNSIFVWKKSDRNPGFFVQYSRIKTARYLVLKIRTYPDQSGRSELHNLYRVYLALFIYLWETIVIKLAENFCIPTRQANIKWAKKYCNSSYFDSSRRQYISNDVVHTAWIKSGPQARDLHMCKNEI